MAVRYGTISTVRYAAIFANKYDTLVRYALLAMIRVRYVGTLHEYAYYAYRTY